MITTTGQSVWPDDTIEHGNPRSNSVVDASYQGGAPSLFDIGTGLSRTPRFAGQTKKFYTVLAHVLTCADLVPDELRVYALLHDAAEAVVGDQVSTWKNPMTKADEQVIMARICAEHGIEFPFPPDVQEVVDWADRATLRAEAFVLGHGEPNHDYFVNVCPFVQGAYDITAKRALTVMSLVPYGFGGDLYRVEVHAALQMASLASRSVSVAT